ncbi:MAG: hemolysin family protein [Holophagales bacterium]|nr:hemolysin family protein [Holophagales bacterium]
MFEPTEALFALSLPIQILLIAAAALYRAGAATLLSSLHGLSSLQRRRLVEEAKEGSLLAQVLESPSRLSLVLVFWNQTLLVALLALTWPLLKSLLVPWWLLAILFLAYIWVFDVALPTLVSSGDQATWVERLFPFFAPLYKLLSPALEPLAAYREKANSALDKAKEEDAVSTDGAMTAFLEEGEAEGILEEEDSELIRNVVNLGDTIVREVMTPRTRINGISVDAGIDEVWEAFRLKRNSRMPIYQNTIDNIQGVLLLKDFIQIQGQDGADWRELAKNPIFVPESKPTLELLRELQRAKTQIAIVVDEYGAVAGLATVEDLLEELVGEIQEEHESSAAIVECSPGVYQMPGETHVEDLASALGIDMEHDGFDTTAGLVMWKLGRLPNPLETIHFQNLSLRVLKMEGTRIVTLEARTEGN